MLPMYQSQPFLTKQEHAQQQFIDDLYKQFPRGAERDITQEFINPEIEQIKQKVIDKALFMPRRKRSDRKNPKLNS